MDLLYSNLCFTAIIICMIIFAARWANKKYSNKRKADIMQTEYSRILIMIMCNVTHENWKVYQDVIESFYFRFKGINGCNHYTNKLDTALIESLDALNPTK